jgi:hypothetical protein
MANLKRMSWTAAAFLLVTCWVELATAAEPPADLCSLLPAAVVNKTLGQTYDSPLKTVAPRPYANTAEGTDCTYQSKSGNLLFRVYVDPSPAAAAELFARLKSFFGRGSTPVAGVGDEAFRRSAWTACPQRQSSVFYLREGSQRQAVKGRCQRGCGTTVGEITFAEAAARRHGRRG